MAAARCSARDVVLALIDTLEAILVCLDMKTLLLSAMRVCTHWHRVMAASPAIQRALFFQPCPAHPGRVAHPLSHDVERGGPESGAAIWSDLNPLLVDKFGRLFFDLGPGRHGELGGFLRRASAFRRLPWSKETAASALLDPPRDGRGAIEYGQRDARVVPHDPGQRRRFTRRHASWRRMLVSQPPPPLLGYFAITTSWSVSSPFCAGLVPPADGLYVRMGHLYDLVQHFAGHHEQNSAWFRVTWKKQREPAPSETTRLVCQRLLRQTSVLVEFEHVSDSFYVDRDPFDESALREFDAAFRCRDFQPPDLSQVRHYKHVWERAGFPMAIYTL